MINQSNKYYSIFYIFLLDLRFVTPKETICVFFVTEKVSVHPRCTPQVKTDLKKY
jgi:hypothetical protein